MSRARELSRLGNPNIISADSSFNVGFGTAEPKEKVNVVGVVSATSFFGDGSTLDGIASAGIGTALSDDKTKALNTIYFTNDEVVVTNNSTVNPPASGHIAYTQAPTVVIDDTKELIVSDGDDLLVDVLGIATGTNVDFAARGNGVFDNIYVDNIESSGGQTSVNFPKGLVSTGVATFHSDVSIGGTLTYEDVKNIDSVGLITARTGIKVSAGGIEVAGGGVDIVGDIGLGAGKQTGTAGQVLTSGGAGATPTWVDAAGGAEYAGIASGSITAGRAVVVASDGKLMATSGTNEVRGTNTQATDNSGGFQVGLTYDTTANKNVLFYRDSADSNKGKVKVGTLSGTTLTWGTVVTFTTNEVSVFGACYDPGNNKVACFYSDRTDGNKGKVVVGTVTGTDITCGIPVDVFGTDVSHGWITYCANSDHNYAAVCTYQNSPYDANCRIGKYSTSSGGNYSAWPNSPVVFDSSSRAICTTCCWDSTANKLVIAYGRYNSTERGTIIAGTIASDAVTFGSSQTFDSSRTDRLDNVIHNPDRGKNLIVWCEGSNGTGYYTLAREATLSGTTFTFGTTYFVSRDGEGTLVRTNMCSAVYDTNAKKPFITYSVNVTAPTEGYAAYLDIDSSGVISSKGWYSFRSGLDNMGDSPTVMGYDADEGKNIAITYGADKRWYYVEGLRVSNMTDNNYVGISQASYTNGQTATISLTGSVNEAVSGLTPANKYYVLADGTLSTTADGANIRAGIAVAANKLYIRGW